MATLISTLMAATLCFAGGNLAFRDCAAADGPGVAELNEEIVLGSSGDEYFFGGVTSVIETANGRIMVADMHQDCVLEFSSTGEMMGRLGRLGDGPGDLMRYSVLGVNERDEIWVLGSGGRVEVVDTEWHYVRSHQRRNPAQMASSIAFCRGNRTAIATANLATDTSIDLYDGDMRYLMSLAPTFAAGRQIDPRTEDTYAGGYVSAGPSGDIYYLQKAPYLVSRYSANGQEQRSAADRASDFVREPRAPEIIGNRVRFPEDAVSTGIAALGDGRIITSCVRHLAGGKSETRICVYDENLRLLGVHSESGRTYVAGLGANGRVYLVRVAEEAILVIGAKGAVREP